MNDVYEFSFERRQLMKLLGGLLSLALLVFSAGFLVGIGLQLRQPAPTLLAQATLPQPAPAPSLAAPPVVTRPKTPVADEDRPAVEPSGDATAIDPDPPAVAAAEKQLVSAVADPGKFAVQVGAFLQSKNA